MFKTFKFVYLLFMILTGFNSVSAYADITPYRVVVNELSFGEIFGFPGSCTLDYSTNVVTNNSGFLCAEGLRFGVPGKIVIYGNPNKVMSIRLRNKINDGDGLAFSASGVFNVSGLPDTILIADNPQLINTGSTGNIVINFGGTLTNTTQQNFSQAFELIIEDALEFTEQ